jgi:hypothetical protein
MKNESIRTQIANRIKTERSKMTFAHFLAIHPKTTGMGAWKYECSVSGWHSYTTCSAMESFGKDSNKAWQAACKNTNQEAA